MTIYVGNLSYSSTEESIRARFEQYGAVESVRIITDRETGRSRGFGFVDMPNGDEAQKAIDETNGKDLDGRTITVNEARPRDDSRRPSRGGDRY